MYGFVYFSHTIIGDIMFYRYEIQNYNGEDVLYLYLDMKYEFSKELDYSNDLEMTKRAHNFVVSNKIPFKGNKIFLIVDGIVVKVLKDTELDQNHTFSNEEYNPDQLMISIQLEDQAVCEITLKDYLISLLFSYYDDAIHEEVYKAICVLFHGYLYQLIRDNKVVSSKIPFGSFQPLSYYQSLYTNYPVILKRFSQIIQSVQGIFLKYQEQTILPFLHYSNDGKTLSYKEYPYLSSVKSIWDLASPYYLTIRDYSYSDIQKILGFPITPNSKISIQNHNTSNILVDNHPYTFSEFQELFHLNSSIFYFIIYKDYIRIITKGLGNSYGLSIFGANEIAKNGANYIQILSYYFPKTKIFKHIKETI